jgi:PAS domain-containing protein
MASVDIALKALDPFFRRMSGAVETLFEHHRARFAIAGALLIGALVSGEICVDRTKRYQEIVSTTVRAQGEDTPQRFKVLEAFIMSTIDLNLSKRIEEATISTDFSKALTTLHTLLSQPRSSPDAKASDPEMGVRLSIPDYIAGDVALPAQNAIVTDDAPNGYLFFPLSLLRTRLGDYQETVLQSQRKQNSATLAKAVAADPVVADDFRLSRALLSTMQSITAVALFDSVRPEQLGASVRPVQIYYITKNGANRIVNNTDAEEQQTVYRNMFRSTTFFPSRPYFVEAFKRTPGSLKEIHGVIKDSFYVSRPYLDIGGFGVVVTLARALDYPGHSDAAICFDLLVSPIEATLKPRLRSFSAEAPKVRCRIGFRSKISCDPTEQDASVPFKGTLEELLNTSMRKGDLSTVVGNINILDDQTASPNAVATAGIVNLLTYPFELIFGLNAHAITFAIPLSQPRALPNENTLAAEFLISSLNLDRFQQISLLLGSTSILLLASAFSVVILSWQSETQARRSYAEAFNRVDEVLYGAPTPYCRLDANDEIVDCNTAFCALLKMPADNQSVQSVKGVSFESRLAQRSIGTYHDVQERRRKGKEVAPYTLYFRCADGSEVEGRVTSGVIPGQTAKELPGTFGVVIPGPS